MRGINCTHIIGNIGKDPELRHTQGGTPVATLSIATSESWYDKNTKEKQEKTEWHRVVAWGKLAEIVSQYAKKGRQIYIQGRIQTRAWDDKDGNKRYSTEVVAKEILLLGKREEESTDLAGAIFDGQNWAPPNDDPEIPF